MKFPRRWRLGVTVTLRLNHEKDFSDRFLRHACLQPFWDTAGRRGRDANDKYLNSGHEQPWMTRIQCESKNPPWGLVAIFPKRLGIFQPNFTCLLRVPIYARLRSFIQLSATLTKLYLIKHDHLVRSCVQNFYHWLKHTLAFSDIFPEQLGIIFSPNFTRY